MRTIQYAGTYRFIRGASAYSMADFAGRGGGCLSPLRADILINLAAHFLRGERLELFAARGQAAPAPVQPRAPAGSHR